MANSTNTSSWDNLSTSGGGLIGGILNAGMGIWSGIYSAKMQERANSTNLEEAKRNREFQERMFRNRHTYEVEDLRNAGLNPILSAGAPSSSVGGAMGRVESTAKDFAQNVQLAKLMSEIKLNNSAKDKMKAETARTIAGTPEVKAKSSLMAEAYNGFRDVVKGISTFSAKHGNRPQQHLTKEAMSRLFKYDPEKYSEYKPAY